MNARAHETKTLRRWLLPTGVLAALLLAIAPVALAKGGGDDGGNDGALKLRLSDAIGKPGGSVALVVRTYAARPIRQGRITVRVRKPAAARLGVGLDELTAPQRPFTFVRAVVFSARGDAVSTARATGGGANQSVQVDFSSRTAGINAADGPLAVIFLRLHPGVTAGQRFTVEVDPAATGLTDAAGGAVAVVPIAAEIVVRAPSAPFAVEAEGAEVAPGELAELGVETQEPFPVSGGRMTLRYDPAARGGLPKVTMDPRYGKSTMTVNSTPGTLVVDFRSADGSLNTIPGRIIAVDLPTSAAAAPGWESPVWLDPQQSWLLARKGNRRLAITLEGGAISFR